MSVEGTHNMNKTINPFIISLLGLLFLFSNPSNIKADEVCATESLESDWKAGQICPQVCQNYQEGYKWNKIWFPSMRGKGCMNQPSSRKNGADSVCQCDLQPCTCKQDGEQLSKCDENLNKLGANQCSSNCDCIKGRICIEGWCKEPPPCTSPCCARCDSDYQARELACNMNPQNRLCYWNAARLWTNCRADCGSSSPLEENKKKAPSSLPSETKNSLPSNAASTSEVKNPSNHQESTKEEETPSESKEPLQPEQKKSPETEKAPREKEPSKPK